MSLMYGDPYLNADQLIYDYNSFLDGLLNGKGGVGLPDMNAVWDILIARGGYFPLAPTATVDDQLGIFQVALVAFIPFIPQESYNSLASNLDNAALEWQSELARGGNQSFSQYLLSIGAQNWF